MKSNKDNKRLINHKNNMLKKLKFMLITKIYIIYYKIIMIMIILKMDKLNYYNINLNIKKI